MKLRNRLGGSLPLSLSLNMNNPFGGAGGGGAGVGFAGAPQLTAPSAPTQAAPTPQSPAPAASGIVPGMSVDGVAPNPADQNNGMGNTAPATGGQTPLDEYSKMYDTKPVGDENKSTPPDVLAASISDYAAAAGKLDFTRGIDPELSTKALAGDPVALMEMMNGVARNAFAQSSYSAGQVTKSALESRLNEVRGSIPEMVRMQQAKAGMLDANSALKHPAAQPLVQAVQAKIAQQFPEATPAEIQNHTLTYLREVGGLFNPASAGNPEQLADGDNATDGWDSFFLQS